MSDNSFPEGSRSFVQRWGTFVPNDAPRGWVERKVRESVQDAIDKAGLVPLDGLVGKWEPGPFEGSQQYVVRAIGVPP